jgi:hypothetical protein
MEDYNKEDVLNALSSLDKKSRKRVLVDQRSYLIGILAYRFMMPEHQIAKITGIKRCTVNHNKTIILDFYKDKTYQENVYVYIARFPFDFSVVDRTKPGNKKRNIHLDLDTKLANKLKVAGSMLGHTDIRVTITFFLEKSLKLWEE